MEKWNELIEKYFRGETTLDEEEKLKQYFAFGEVEASHEPYRALFEAFTQERTENCSKTIRLPEVKKNASNRFWIRTIAVSGIAASLILAVWMLNTESTDTYAIVNGQRINNPEYAQQIAEEKMKKVSDVFEKNMKSMENIDKVKKSMEPIQRINRIREELKQQR
jgi:hypothetical protein